MSQQTLKVMQSRDLKRTTSKQNIGHTLGTVGIYAFLLFMALVVLFPFYWMVISSLKSLAEYRMSKPTFWPQTLLLSRKAMIIHRYTLMNLTLSWQTESTRQRKNTWIRR